MDKINFCSFISTQSTKTTLQFQNFLIELKINLVFEFFEDKKYVFLLLMVANLWVGELLDLYF